MRFLIALRHAGYARYLQSTLRALCERGHEVVVLVGIQAPASKSHVGLLKRFAADLDELADQLDGLTVRPGIEPRGSRQRELGGSLRSWLDYLHFQEPERQIPGVAPLLVVASPMAVALARVVPRDPVHD